MAIGKEATGTVITNVIAALQNEGRPSLQVSCLASCCLDTQTPVMSRANSSCRA